MPTPAEPNEMSIRIFLPGTHPTVKPLFFLGIILPKNRLINSPFRESPTVKVWITPNIDG